MGKIREGVSAISLDNTGGSDLARAIMTTDTVPKEYALLVRTETDSYCIGGIAKGAGMIHPNMATMLSFITTDAMIDPDFLKNALKKAVDNSFNMITIDGDTSTNDMVVILANGLANNKAWTISVKLTLPERYHMPSPIKMTATIMLNHGSHLLFGREFSGLPEFLVIIYSLR